MFFGEMAVLGLVTTSVVGVGCIKVWHLVNLLESALHSVQSLHISEHVLSARAINAQWYAGCRQRKGQKKICHDHCEDPV